jgi:hypothetical protein
MPHIHQPSIRQKREDDLAPHTFLGTSGKFAADADLQRSRAQLARNGRATFSIPPILNAFEPLGGRLPNNAKDHHHRDHQDAPGDDDAARMECFVLAIRRMQHNQPSSSHDEDTYTEPLKDQCHHNHDSREVPGATEAGRMYRRELLLDNMRVLKMALAGSGDYDDLSCPSDGDMEEESEAGDADFERALQALGNAPTSQQRNS